MSLITLRSLFFVLVHVSYDGNIIRFLFLHTSNRNLSMCSLTTTFSTLRPHPLLKSDIQKKTMKNFVLIK